MNSRIDHHLHTAWHSPDSVIDPLRMIDRARRAGLTGVVITEHDYQWHADELAEIQAAAGDLVVLSGVEVSAYEGHFLVYGLPGLDEVGPGIRLSELLALVRRHDAAIVAAHPFRWEQDFEAIVAEHGPVFDALEVVSNNVSRPTRQLTEQLLMRHPMGRTGSSDAHQEAVIGCYHSVIPGEIRTMRAFVDALRYGATRPGHAEGAMLVSGPVEDRPAPGPRASRTAWSRR
jgi:predicted metal-dependent phosphoesterase TrpH